MELLRVVLPPRPASISPPEALAWRQAVVNGGRGMAIKPQQEMMLTVKVEQDNRPTAKVETQTATQFNVDATQYLATGSGASDRCRE